MNARPILAAAVLLGNLPASAQNVKEVPDPDPVLEAIQEFKKRDEEAANEVTVTLDPVGEPTAPVESEKPAADAPVLVTGQPPEDANVSAAAAPQPPQETLAPAEETPAAPAAEPDNGLAVRVEKLQPAGGTIDPAKVKLLAPFPAKPLAQPPAGWQLDVADNAPPFTREVEIADGTKVTLSIRPHVLVPVADGADVFTISEPGYDNSLGYRQTTTVGAILANSVRQLDEDSKQLGSAIDSLQQLLVSLPQPEQPQPEPKPAPTTRKR